MNSNMTFLILKMSFTNDIQVVSPQNGLSRDVSALKVDIMFCYLHDTEMVSLLHAL